MLTGVINITGTANFSSNPALYDLSGLAALETVGSSLSISNNSNIENVDFLSSLTSAGSISLNNSENLTDISGLSSLTSLGDFNISSTKISDISVLSSLSSLGTLSLQSTDIVDYTPLKEITLTGIINVDAFDENTILPTDGKWCVEKTYTNLKNNEDVRIAATRCSDDASTFENNAGWASYLHTKYDTNRITGAHYYCNPSSTEITETSLSGNCASKSFGPSEYSYPYGIIGLENHTNISFNNNTLKDLNMLRGTKAIIGTANFSSNPELSDLSGLSEIETVGGALSVSNNSNITNVNFLSSLTSVGAIALNGNSNLTDISGLSSLVNSGSFNISSSPISDISVMSNLTTVGTLSLQATNIVDYTPLKNISISGIIYVDTFDENTILPTEGRWCTDKNYLSLNNSDNILLAAESCGDDTSTFENNAGWASYLYGKFHYANKNYYRCNSSSTEVTSGSLRSWCSGRNLNSNDSNYPYGKIGLYNYGNIYFQSNSLVDLNMLNGIVNTTGLANFSSNPDLIDLSSLSTLKTVGGALTININANITNVSFLNSLTSVGSISLSSNSNLTDISGLSSLTSSGAFNISSSPISDISVMSNLTTVGTLSLQATNIVDYTPLKEITITGAIYVDPFDENTILPTDGKWCTDKTYLNLVLDENIRISAQRCGDDASTYENNAGWASYLYSKFYYANRNYYRCNSSSTSVTSGTLSSWCGGRGFGQSDNNYPYGIIGFETYGNIYFNSNNLTDLNMLTGIKTVTGLANFSSNLGLTDLSDLSTLETITGALSITSNTNITNVDFLGSLTSAGSVSLSNNTNLTDISGLSSLITVNTLSFQSTNIVDYTALKEITITSTINVDAFDVNTILPTNGKWCVEQTYLKLATEQDRLFAADKCAI